MEGALISKLNACLFVLNGEICLRVSQAIGPVSAAPEVGVNSLLDSCIVSTDDGFALRVYRTA